MANEFIARKGLISLGGITVPHTQVTGTYLVTADDYLIESTSGTFTISLPTAVGIKGKLYIIKNSGNGTITVDPNLSQTIDGNLTQILAAKEALSIQSNGTNWIVENGDTARHYLAGDQTSRSIQKKLGGFGETFLGKTIAGIGSNIGGVIHEAQNVIDGRPIMESVEDAANNLAGSIGAFLPEKASIKLLDRYKKFAPDGKVKN